MSTMSAQLRKIGKTRKERAAVVRRAFKPDLYDRLHFDAIASSLRRAATNETEYREACEAIAARARELSDARL